jgi:hypothetical protein
MKILCGHKDGGPQSEVRCWGIEIKSLFSIMLLRFTKHTREDFHSHAFGSISWLLKGRLAEERVFYHQGAPGIEGTTFKVGLRPIVITKDNLHRVRGIAKTNWALTFRGPWEDTWRA